MALLSEKFILTPSSDYGGCPGTFSVPRFWPGPQSLNMALVTLGGRSEKIRRSR